MSTLRRVDVNRTSRKERPIKTYGDLKQHLTKTYSPCNHQEACNKTAQCLCVNCEKFCSCAIGCRKRVPKCTCRTSCMSTKCICYSSQRECSPDVCGCHSCKNIGIQRGLGKCLKQGLGKCKFPFEPFFSSFYFYNFNFLIFFLSNLFFSVYPPHKV